MPNCTICGEPMPPGEEMFKFHGYSGDCPKPPLPKPDMTTPHVSDEMLERASKEYDKALQQQSEEIEAGNRNGFDSQTAIRAALTAALTAMPGQGWRPIETAPKDGKLLLLCATPGRWVEKKNVVLAGYWGRNGWVAQHGGHPLSFATHWQPLPSPPPAQENGNDG